MPLLISFSFRAELAPCSKDLAVLSPSIVFFIGDELQYSSEYYLIVKVNDHPEDFNMAENNKFSAGWESNLDVIH